LDGVGVTPLGHVEFVEDEEAWGQTFLQEISPFRANTISPMLHM